MILESLCSKRGMTTAWVALRSQCRLQGWVTVDPTNLCTRCTCANLCVGRNFSCYTVRCYSRVAAGAFRYHWRQHHHVALKITTFHKPSHCSQCVHWSSCPHSPSQMRSGRNLVPLVVDSCRGRLSRIFLTDPSALSPCVVGGHGRDDRCAMSLLNFAISW